MRAARVRAMGLGVLPGCLLAGSATRKALDGLYLVIGEAERAIREQPAAAASAIAAKAFGALR